MTISSENARSEKAQAFSAKRYQAMFNNLKKQNQTALIPFTLLGYPNKNLSLDVIKAMIDAGASALELGIAFSDPMADGPVLQAASGEVIANGFGVSDAMALLKDVRAYHADVPIGLLVYYNVVLSFGLECWFSTLAEIGVDAVMIVDLPLESLDEIQALSQRHGVELVLMVSPLTDAARIKEIASKNPAFLYVVSRLGITGTHATYDDHLQSMLTQIKSVTDIPSCVGFGISTPDHVTGMRKLGADGVIVGSAVIKTISGAMADKKDPVAALKEYLLQLKAACVK